MTMGKNGGWGIAGSEVSGWLLTFGADRPIIEEACI
jgi:hypothetical protein